MNNQGLVESPAIGRRPIIHLDSINQSDDLNRLLCTAVVNQQFRRKLLMAPTAAVMDGHKGYHFSLTDSEFDAISGIKEKTLRSFASELMARLSQPEEILDAVDASCLTLSIQQV